MNHKKELLWSLWVSLSFEGCAQGFFGGLEYNPKAACQGVACSLRSRLGCLLAVFFVVGSLP